MTVKRNNIVNPLDKYWRVIFFPNQLKLKLKFPRKTIRAVEAFKYIFRIIMSIDSSPTGNKEKSFSTLRTVRYKINDHASKRLLL